MPDRAITGFPDCSLGEFLILCLQLLQADDVRLGFGEPAYQHRKAATNAVHVEGRDLHLFPLQVSETNKVAGPRGKLQTKSKRMPARSWPASRPVRHLSEIRPATHFEREKTWRTTTLCSRRACRSGVRCWVL